MATILLGFILILAFVAVCLLLAAIGYFLRSPCLRRASLVSYAAGNLSFFVLFMWFEADSDHKFISALGTMVVPILFLQAGMWLGFRSVLAEGERDAPPGERRE